MFETGQKFSTKDTAEDLHGQEERIARADPTTVVWRYSARRNSAVNVGMQQQVLSPSVKNANHADFCPQVYGIGRDLQQRLRAGSEQQVVEQTRVVQGQHMEFMGHSEHHMEGAGGQEFSLMGRQPTLARLGLALGTVPISARVVRDGLMSTAQAGIPVATPCCGAATLNATKRLELLEVKAGSITVQEVIALRA